MSISCHSFYEPMPYSPIFKKMRDFTLNRDKNTQDEIWFLEHQSVYTQGQAGKPEHIINPQDIPVVQSDRGGQVTYHGPGQLMTYCLIDLSKQNIGPRALVTLLENVFIELLGSYNLDAYAKPDAPGIYIDEAKIASIGLRIRKHCSYHGVSFNCDLDLAPFDRINPCGFKHLKMTRLIDHVPGVRRTDVQNRLKPILEHHLEHTHQEVPA